MRGAAPALLAFLSLTLLAPGSSRAEGTGGFTPAAECGLCHLDIYRTWQRTFHAQASVNPVFLQELDLVETAQGRGARVVCLACHAPTAVVTMDYSLAGDISREGVTCDFCHTVTSVDLAQKGMKLRNEPSPVKQGPGRPDALPAHQTARSALLLQADFCAGCHQWFNDAGVPLLDTWGEWQASPYRGESFACQFCHMPEILKARTLLQGKFIERPSHLHMEMGGHSQTRLATAAKLALEAGMEEGTVEADVTVENFKGGHMLPTGLPNRSVILQVTFLDDKGEVLDRQERAYRRLLGDERDTVLEDVAGWYLRATRVLEDTRIKPKEKRRERFTFTPPEGVGALIVHADLLYRLGNAAATPAAVDYAMASSSRIVGRGERSVDITRGLAIALAVLILALVTLIVAKLRFSRDQED